MPALWRSAWRWAAGLPFALLIACGQPSVSELTAKARERLASGDRATAVIHLKSALQSDPQAGEARALLGQALIDDDPTAAEVELNKALELKVPPERVLPTLTRAMLQLGQTEPLIRQYGNVVLSDATALADVRTMVAAAYAQRGSQVDAERMLDAALRASPDHPGALMVRARLVADRGDPDRALAILDRILAKDPGHAQAGVARGYLIWTARGDADVALRAHRAVLAKHPDNVPALAEIVTLLFASGQRDEARKAFEHLRKVAPLHPQTQFFEAQFAFLDGQYPRVQETTALLIKAMPTHVRALELAAATEYRLGNDTKAQALVARALAVDGGLVLARQIGAQSLLRTGRPLPALEMLRPLLARSEVAPDTLALAGRAHLQLGQPAEADRVFQLAAAAPKASIRVKTDAAMAALTTAGREPIAIDALQSLAAADPGVTADLALFSARVAQRDAAGAVNAVDALAAKMPGKALPSQLRGQVLAARGDAAGARKAFEAAAAAEPGYFPAVAALASMDVALGKHGDAAKRVDAFVEREPKHAQAWLLRAEIDEAAGRPAEDVLRHLNAAVRADPTDRQARLALIGRYQRLGDLPAALGAARGAAEALPTEPAVQEALARVQLLAGQPRQAVATARALSTSRPEQVGPLMLLAEALLAAGDRDAGRQALKDAARLGPDLPQPRRALALLAAREGRFDEALDLARQLQQRKDDRGLGHLVEGEVHTARADWASAAAAFRTALQRSGAGEAALKLHGSLVMGGQSAQAEKVAGEWLRSHPNDAAFRYHLGDVATQRGQFEQAEAQYRQVLELQPRNALAMNNLAWALVKQKKPQALELARQAATLMPGQPPILDTLAAAQAAAGRWSDAIDTQREAVRLAPSDHGLRLNLARHLIGAGERERARRELEALARLGPDFPRQAEVKRLLSQT